MIANKKTHPKRHPSVLWSRIKFRWPFLIWLPAAVATVWLYTLTEGSLRFNGVVESVHEMVGPLESGRLMSLNVELGQRVVAGQILAELDPSLLEAQMEVERMRIERQFEDAMQRDRSELRAALRSRSEAEAELGVLNRELERLERMLERRLIDGSETLRYRIRRDFLAEQLEQMAAPIEELTTSLSEMESRRARMLQALAGGVNDEIKEDGALGWLELRRREYALRANRDGVVVEIAARPGDVVQEGEPFIKILSDCERRVIGYLPEWYSGRVEAGQAVDILPADGGVHSTGRILAISPNVAQIPEEIAPLDARQARRVYWLVIEVENDRGLVPGESVKVFSGTPWWQRLPFIGRAESEPK